MHAMTPDECRQWLGIEEGNEPEALIFMGLVDYPQALAAWSAVLSDERKGMFPNLLIGRAGDLRLAVGAGYGAAVAGDIAHLCCTLGTRFIVVTGYCGGLQPGIAYRDVIIPSRAHPMDAVSPHYLDGHDRVEASLEVVEWLKERCDEENIPSHLGPLVSAPSIMTETEDHFREWQRDGFYGVDLEVAVLFSVARRFGARRGALLAQSDSPIDGVYVSERRSEEDRARMMERQLAIGRIAYQAALHFGTEQA